MRVLSLRIHPVKSTAIVPVEQAYVGRAGLRGDREWMVVDADGAMVSARKLPRLFAIHATPQASGGLVLRSEGHPDLPVARPAVPRADVTMFDRDPMPSVAAADSAGDWLGEVLGTPGLRLVWCAEPAKRRLNPAYARSTDMAAFQDGYPVTIASMASMRQLNEWIREAGGAAVEVDRFRPNIVIDGEQPFAEDEWRSVRIGEVTLRAAKPVDRCAMTLIEPGSLARGKEPIRTLSRHRKREGKTLFCHHLIPDVEGAVAVGDEVVAG